MARQSLYLRVATPLVVGVALATLAIIRTGTVFRDRIVRQLASDRAQSLSAQTRNGIVRLMRSGHRTELQVVLDEVASDRDIAAVRILSPDGLVRRSARVDEVGRRVAPERTRSVTENVLHTLEPIRSGPACHACHGPGEIVALLDLDVSLAGPLRSATSWWNWSLMLAGAQSLFVILLSTAIVGLLVVRPLRRLRGAMDQVRAGDMHVQLPRLGNREMDELADGFNAMVARRREAEEAAADAHRRDLERQERLAIVGQMAASLAHEIRNPLTGVKAVLELVARPGVVSESRLRMLEQALTELDRVERVLRNLLDYARPRTPTTTAVNLTGVIAAATPLLQVQAEQAGAELQLALDDTLPEVSADAEMVRQVFVNLTLNAMQAVSAGPQRLVTISTARCGDQMVCRVRDTGPGVAASNAEAVFGAFFTTKARGTGLGLAISQRLIELQGGRLWLENPGEPGASFAFTLPVTPTGAGTASAACATGNAA